LLVGVRVVAHAELDDERRGATSSCSFAVDPDVPSHETNKPEMEFFRDAAELMCMND
jgi:hypothetical protein